MAGVGWNELECGEGEHKMSTVVELFVWIGRFGPEGSGYGFDQRPSSADAEGVHLSTKLGVTLGTAKRFIRSCQSSFQSATVTRKKVAGMDVIPLCPLLF